MILIIYINWSILLILNKHSLFLFDNEQILKITGNIFIKNGYNNEIPKQIDVSITI